ncbi:MAG: hypothetical protein IJ689_06915 [Alphaproteobacteria bacterium]|nr:hypothetical protein [Alphaproteobacteria bacterium]
MKNYILMLGVAGVALGSYCAYAGNSATMTVTATINHDVSLNVTQDLDMGTIIINPAYDGDDTDWSYNATGVVYGLDGAIVSADDATVGEFTANIPNPSACVGGYLECGGLELMYNFNFGGNNNCDIVFSHTSGNNFVVYPENCYMSDFSNITAGEHSDTITISYTPES